jgi:phosphoribosylformylglycinamidine synthase subunit PurS
MYLAKVYVSLKKSVLDPQGVTIKHSMDSLGYKTIKDVRMGKYFEVKLEGNLEEEVETTVKDICEKLLINPVIEEYYYDLEEIGMPIDLRTYEDKDKKDVNNLIKSIVVGELSEKMDKYSDLDNISESYSNDKDVFLVGLVDGKVIATAAIKEDDTDTAVLRRVFVDKEYRQKGCGIELIKKIMQIAKEKQYKKITFRSSDKMISAVNLMMKEGFIEKEVVHVGDDKIFMLEKIL